MSPVPDTEALAVNQLEWIPTFGRAALGQGPRGTYVLPMLKESGMGTWRVWISTRQGDWELAMFLASIRLCSCSCQPDPRKRGLKRLAPCFVLVAEALIGVVLGTSTVFFSWSNSISIKRDIWTTGVCFAHGSGMLTGSTISRQQNILSPHTVLSLGRKQKGRTAQKQWESESWSHSYN